MNTKNKPDCNCTNCDRSCYRNGGVVNRQRTTREQAKKRLADLKRMVSGGES